MNPVSKVKALREEAEQLFEGKIKKLITCSGEVLRDDMTLGDAGIECGSSVHAVMLSP